MDKNRIMMIVIIALLVILLGTIAFVSIYAINLINSPSANGEEHVSATGNGAENAVTIVQDKITIVAYDDAVKATIKDSNDDTHAITFKFTIGINNSDKKQEKDVTDLADLLTSRETVVKSFVNEIIYNHTHEEYNNDREVIQRTLSGEILERLQLEFGSNLIIAVYISEFLYQ